MQRVRRRGRLLIGAAVFALASLTITACSPGSTDGTEPGGESASPGSGEQVTIEYWDLVDPNGDGPRSVALKAMIEGFETANPDIKVDVQVVPWADTISRLPQAAASGQEPDVARVYSGALAVMVEAGVFQPLDSYAADVPRDAWIQPWESTFVNGEKIVMPYEHRAAVLLYNKKILEENNVAVPTTWDELVDAAAKLTAAGYTGFGTGFSEAQDATVVMESFATFGVQLGDGLFSDDGTLQIDGPIGKGFFTFFRHLMDSGALTDDVIQGTYETANEGLINGTVAMAMLGTHRILSTQAGNPDIAWAPAPVADGGRAATAIAGWSQGMGKHTEHPEEAWRFINYMTGPEAQALLATGGEVPARAGVMSSEFLSTDQGKSVQSFADYIQERGVPQPYPVEFSQLSRATATALQNMYVNGVSADDALREVVNRLG